MTNNNPPMPERINVCRVDDPKYLLGTEYRHVFGDTEYVRSDLSRPRLTDDEVEALNKEVIETMGDTEGPHFEMRGGVVTVYPERIVLATIKYLRQRGII
jgi:hypothetical protein